MLVFDVFVIFNFYPVLVRHYSSQQNIEAGNKGNKIGESQGEKKEEREEKDGKKRSEIREPMVLDYNEFLNSGEFEKGVSDDESVAEDENNNININSNARAKEIELKEEGEAKKKEMGRNESVKNKPVISTTKSSNKEEKMGSKKESMKSTKTKEEGERGNNNKSSKDKDNSNNSSKNRIFKSSILLM
jgi:lipopolysaccharide export LptBFGC system permease protein LptF